MLYTQNIVHRSPGRFTPLGIIESLGAIFGVRGFRGALIGPPDTGRRWYDCTQRIVVELQQGNKIRKEVFAINLVGVIELLGKRFCLSFVFAIICQSCNNMSIISSTLAFPFDQLNVFTFDCSCAFEYNIQYFFLLKFHDF